MGKKLGMERQRELRRDMVRGKGNKGNVERKRKWDRERTARDKVERKRGTNGEGQRQGSERLIVFFYQKHFSHE
jgi:hypothetical protein